MEFFITNGLTPLEIDVRNSKVYHKFERDNKAEDVFSVWCSRTA